MPTPSLRIPAAAALALALAAACVVPPSTREVDFAQPPIVDLARVFASPPSSSRLGAGQLSTTIDGTFDVDPCLSREFSLSGVIDRDDDRLLYRFVANNGSLEQPAEIIRDDDERRDPNEPDEPFDFLWNVNLIDTFDEQIRVAAFSDGAGQQQATVTLFVTDAPEWTFDPPAVPPGNDFSVIPEGTGAVTGFQWTLLFERGPCSDFEIP